MKSFLLVVTSALLALAFVGIAQCESVAIHAAEVTTDQTAPGMPRGTSLRDLLVSRLDRGQVHFVEQPEQADIVMSGSYSSFGRMFSWDVLLKNRKSGSIITVFEQGDSNDDIIPAAGRLSRKVDKEIAGMISPMMSPAPSAPLPQSIFPTSSAVVTPPVTPPAVPTAVKPAAESFVIKTETEADVNGWNSGPIDGIFGSMTLGRRLPSGERELFVAGERIIRFYHKGAELKLVAEATVPVSAHILAIDSADLDHDGITELYATIIDRDVVSSRVYRAEGQSLKLVADNLPWFFRGIGADITARTIYAQEMGVRGGFSTEARELAWDGQRYEARTSVTLPQIGTIFNFQRIRGPKGIDYFVTLDADASLAVADTHGEEVWKSADKFGGSEVRFRDIKYSASRVARDMERWIFLEQRMMPLPDGSLIVPRNEGTLSIGNNRNFNRHALFAFRWNGAMLTEVWHTRQTSGYLADYAYDSALRELVLLEVVKKEGLFSKGRSVITTYRID